MVKYTRKREGGSYRAPIERLERFRLRICNAHGTITPEYYYIVPDNVFILLPNSCGLPTSTNDVVSESIFFPAEEGAALFMDRFLKGGTRTETGAQFTVYVPGDILPIHVFDFNSMLAWKTDELQFGYVGIFLPGALVNLPFLHHPVAPTGVERNLFKLRWYPTPAGEIYPYIPEGRLDIAQNFCMTIINYLRTAGPHYKEMLKKYKDIHARTITRSDCLQILDKLIPMIPQNTIAPAIVETRQHAYSMYDVVNHCEMKKTDAPLIILMNACRSLQEQEAVDFDTDMTPSKPSMMLIRALSNAVHTDEKATSLNIKQIQAFRDVKGLPSIPFPVMKYDALFTFLSETFIAYNPETDSAYKPLMDLLESFMIMLRDYKPFGIKPRATAYMEENIDRIHAQVTELAATAAATATTAKNVLIKAEKTEAIVRLKRRREALKTTRLQRKSRKENTTNINRELASIKDELDRL